MWQVAFIRFIILKQFSWDSQWERFLSQLVWKYLLTQLCGARDCWPELPLGEVGTLERVA